MALEEPVHAGMFGRMSRAQYAALLSMRWSMFKNTVRSPRGAVEFGARGAATVIYSIFGLGLAVGLGAISYALASDHLWTALPAVFWALFLIWQVVPVFLASFEMTFDLDNLLRFPVGFGAYCLLHLLFGLLDVSSIIGGLCCLGVGIGITLARSSMFLWAAIGLLAFAAFNVLLVRAIFVWIDRWLAQRRTREILSMILFCALLCLQFFNPAFRSPSHSRARWMNAEQRRVFLAVQRWFPPGLAANFIGQGANKSSGNPVESLGLLGLYAMAAGGVLAVRLRAESRGENFGDAPARATEEPRGRRWMLDGSGPLAAVMEKELRTLMRALPLLYGVGAPLLMVFLLSGLYRKSGSLTGQSMPLALLISLGYALVGFTQIFYNNLGADGPGIQVLFLSPTPVRTVILAKNLLYGSLYLFDAAIVYLLTSFRLGKPSPPDIAATVAWLLFSLPVHWAAGNVFSIVMPYRMNLGRLGRQRGSQMSNLFSMLIQVGVLGIGAAVIALCSYFGRLWIAVPVLLTFAAIATGVWLRLLHNSDALTNRHRENMLATLVKAE